MTENFPINLQRDGEDDLNNGEQILGVFSSPQTDTSILEVWEDRYTPIQPLERNTKQYSFDIPPTATNIFTNVNEISYRIVGQVEK